MCQEGIRIGRRTTIQSVNITAPVGDYAQALKSRPSRIALIITYAGVATDPTTGYVMATNSKSAGKCYLGSVNLYNPNVMLDVERHGQLVTGEVWLFGMADALDASVTEVYLIDTLEEAARK